MQQVNRFQEITELILEKLNRNQLLILMTLLSRSLTDYGCIWEVVYDYLEIDIDSEILDFCEDLEDYQKLRLIAKIADQLANEEKQIHQQLKLPIAI